MAPESEKMVHGPSARAPEQGPPQSATGPIEWLWQGRRLSQLRQKAARTSASAQRQHARARAFLEAGGHLLDGPAARRDAETLSLAAQLLAQSIEASLAWYCFRFRASSAPSAPKISIG